MTPVLLVAGSVLLVIGSVGIALAISLELEDRQRRRAREFTHRGITPGAAASPAPVSPIPPRQGGGP